ncbi:formate dehydrogenase subunit gamma [Nitratireductor indicus]|uniref:formate dehydrogenase subunit gamma n=1 Tax=Nitratireductor indicus TaxID=721133 RepID=UPI0028769384|nr:formate dehydrogenase subunit gamma [Nitratireductor indicus]MDS1137175.1 formate dehydrogenase subunit gamma [Nitratireductor indicus]
MQHARTENASTVQSIVERWREEEGPLLPILNGIQRELGYVPRESVPVIAEALNLSRAEVYGVVSFYHDYREKPAGRHVLKVCRAEACQSVGGDAVAERLEQLLGIRFHETSADGAVTLEPVYCLGLCACAPSAMLDGEVIGRIDDEKAADIARRARA